MIWNLESLEFSVVSRFGLDHHGDPYRPGKYTASRNMGRSFTGRIYYGILTAYRTIEYRVGSARVILD